MTRGALTSTIYNGKTLEQLHEDIRGELERAASINPNKPLRVEDAMTKVGLLNPFDRQVIKRTFMTTLKEGGSNFERLTLRKKWAKGREKWGDVPAGKVTITFDNVTDATADLATKVQGFNGDLSADVQAAASSIVVNLASRANAKLDKATLSLVAEDVGTILADNAALARENALHERYRKQNETQMKMMQSLVAKLTGGDGTGVTT
jgi:hypothetical protein